MQRKSGPWFVLVLTCALAWPALAQDNKNAAANREREMLRRTQQALRDAQAQQEAAQREKSTLTGERAALQEDLKRESAKSQLASSQLASTKRELAKLRAEREAVETQRAAADKDNQALKARVQALEQQLAQSQRQVEERAQAVTRLTALVGASAQALSSAEAKNRQLYSAGMKAVEAYRGKGFGDVAAQREPVFGLRGVELENAAESLRSQLDAERLPTTPARPASEPAASR